MKCSSPTGAVLAGGFAGSKRCHTFCFCCFPLCFAQHFRRRITISKLVKLAPPTSLLHESLPDEMSLDDFVYFIFLDFRILDPPAWNLRAKKRFFPNIDLASRRTHADTPGKVSVSLRWRCVTPSPFFFHLWKHKGSISLKKTVFPSVFSFKMGTASSSQLRLFPSLARWQVLNVHSAARVRET